MSLLGILCVLLSINESWLQYMEGSGADNMIDEYWLQRLIERMDTPKFLMQKAYEQAETAKPFVDMDELLTLDAMVPDQARKEFAEQILSIGSEKSNITLEQSTDAFMAVVYYAFRSFGCDQDNIWPSVYNLTRDNLNCLAFNLIEKVYTKSEFTRKYFARAIHFGITSMAPIEHRIHEMSVYQYLLPNLNRVWFNNLKIQFKNSFWNEHELTRLDTYEDNSFMCGSIPFTDNVQDKINLYYSHRQ
uniref:Uncharacterized protein n=1 Tax=Caenorhabditis japonica TaxID=281687 RepID=A0A8R1HMK6_CAEJA